MKKQYILQIANHQNYPFDGAKQGCSVVVRTSLSLTPQTQIQNHSKVNTLIKLKSTNIMQIIRIVQFKTKKFQVDFEYVSQSFKHSSKMNQVSFIPVLRQFLSQYFKFLIDNRIKHQIRLEDIGITQSGQLKAYLGLNFQLISALERENLQEEYQIMVQKLIDSNFNFRENQKTPSDHTFISDYSHRVSKKLSQLEDRLNKVRKYSKNSSLSSSHSHSNGKNQQLSSNNILKDLFVPKKASKNEVAAGLTSNSFILHKNGARTKTHKLSFGDYETNSYRLDESTSKESSLAKRINTALEKTQFAFKVYQKYSRKKQRKRS